MFMGITLTTATLVVFSGMSETPITATTEDGRILVNGEPRFIIGLYEYLDDDERLHQAADAGFNLFHSRHDREFLDRIAAVSAHAWLAMGMQMNIHGDDPESRATRLASFVDDYKDHPALAVWEGPDEALWNTWYGRLEYYWSGQDYEAMREAAAGLSDDEQDAIEADIVQMQTYLGRSLWAEADAVRARIWERLGAPMPRPDLQLAPMAEEAYALGDGLTAGIELIKERDPHRIVWLNHAPRNAIASMQHHNRAADMAGCDIYPVPTQFPPGHTDLPDQTIASVGAYTRRMAESAPGKAIAMVLQGFGWADFHEGIEARAERSGEPFGRQPTYHESRFMAFDAIVNGAAAILYWGTAYIDPHGELWYDLLSLARELDALQPALSAPAESNQPTIRAHEGYGSIDADDPLCLLKRVDNEYVLIVVNEALVSTAITVADLPPALNGRTLYRLYSDESLTVENGSFQDGISALTAYVYATSRQFEADPVEPDDPMPTELPAPIQGVLDTTEPLEHGRGDRLPLYLWPAKNPPQMTDAEARALVRALDERGIGLVSTWNHNHIDESLAVGLPVARVQRTIGQPIAIDATPLLYSFFDGDERTAHIDADGNPFWDDSFANKTDMGCPFALDFRKEPMRERLMPFIERYAEEDLSVGFIFADWEIDGPIEWNDAWAASKRCTRCRENVPDIDDNFLAFQHALRRIRSELQREVYAEPVLEEFPRALVGNYAVYPHNGFRYWYDFFERYVEGQPEIRDQRARYRHWANEFPETGYTFAMPVVYPWSWTYHWYDFDVPDYRWFYNMLKVGSNAGRHTPSETPIITFVHWHTVELGDAVGAESRETTPEDEQISPWAYQELLWHLLLRGHDTFFLWCQTHENEREVELLHPVYREAQAYGEFLDNGTPVVFDVPERPGTVVSGLRLGDRVLIRRTDFVKNPEAVTVRVGTRNLPVPPVLDENQILRLH